jgi:hypothetical protein
MTFVATDQIVRPAHLSNGQQHVVRGIGRGRNARQGPDPFGEFIERIDQLAGLGRP